MGRSNRRIEKSLGSRPKINHMQIKQSSTRATLFYQKGKNVVGEKYIFCKYGGCEHAHT